MRIEAAAIAGIPALTGGSATTEDVLVKVMTLPVSGEFKMMFLPSVVSVALPTPLTWIALSVVPPKTTPPLDVSMVKPGRVRLVTGFLPVPGAPIEIETLPPPSP